MPKLSDEQRAQRRTFIGASDIGAIAGLNQFKDAFDVLNAKLGYVEEGEDNGAAEWGHRLEPVVREWYATQAMTDSDGPADYATPAKLIPCGTVRHPQREWMGCTLDSKILGTRRGLEIKIVGHRMVFDWDPGDDEGVPHYVRAQCAWQMMVVDLDEIDVAALLGGTKARVWRIKRDGALEDKLLALGEEFWRRHVQGGIAPELTASDGVRAYLNGKYPPLPAPVIVGAGPDEEETARALKDQRALRDMADRYVREAQASFIELLGEKGATDLVGDGWEFRYRQRKDGSRQPWFKWKGER